MMEENNKDKELLDFSQMFKKGTESDTKFQEEQYSPYPFEPKIIQWLIKYSGGLIKNPREAIYVLILFVTISIILTIFLFFNFGQSNIPPEALEQPEYGLPIKD